VILVVTISITDQDSKVRKILNDYFLDSYKIIEVIKENSFHQYVVRVDNIERRVIVDLDDMAIKEYHLIDENFRQCLDNE